MHNPTSISHFYFFSSAFVKSKAAMPTTLRATFTSANPLHSFRRMAAERMNSTSMHRHRASIAQSPCVIKHQSLKDSLNVVVRRVRELVICKVSGACKEGVGGFFAHGAIVRGFGGGVYSYFSSVGFVHVLTVNKAGA